MPSKVWDEIDYPFPNFNGYTVDVCVWISNVIPHLDKGLDMVDKAGVGEKKWISQKWLSNETNKQTIPYTCYD